MIDKFKKHPVRYTILSLVLIIVLAVGGILAAQAISAGNKAARMKEQLSLGTRYLQELDFEAALVCFNNVLNIEYRNVPAYMGAALAYEGLQEGEKAADILEQGIENANDAFLLGMRDVDQSGQSLLEQFELIESAENADASADPFGTLKILGSEYYTWDVYAAAGTFGLDMEENTGKKVDFGSYKGMNLNLDATGTDPIFSLRNADYLYEYRFLTATELQRFLLDCIGDSNALPSLSEVDWQMKAGATYEEILSQLGLPVPQPGVYTLYDSDYGYIGYALWTEGGNINLSFHMAAGRPMGIHLVFTENGLVRATYICDLPENIRSNVLRMAAQVF